MCFPCSPTGVTWQKTHNAKCPASTQASYLLIIFLHAWQSSCLEILTVSTPYPYKKKKVLQFLNVIVWISFFIEHGPYDFASTHSKLLDWIILIIVQRDATQSSLFIILQVHSTCFGCQPHPSSGVHKTVTTASGTGHIFCAATSLQCGQLGHVGGR